MTAYFPELTFGGQTYDFPHLEPFTFTVHSQMAKRDLHLHVTFSNHCFSYKYKPEKHPEGEPIIDVGSPRPRTFCPIRYRLSKQLPALLLALNHPKCKVKQTARRRNWVYTMKIEDPAGLYYVFLKLPRQSSKADKNRT